MNVLALRHSFWNHDDVVILTFLTTNCRCEFQHCGKLHICTTSNRGHDMVGCAVDPITPLSGKFNLPWSHSKAVVSAFRAPHFERVRFTGSAHHDRGGC